jgi:hypothetical protein
MKRYAVHVFVIASTISTLLFAVDPLGPPKASLAPGQLSLALDYSYSDLQLVDVSGSKTSRVDIDNMHTTYLTLSMGALEWLEVFVRVGGVAMDGSKLEDGSWSYTRWGGSKNYQYDYDYDWDWIYGGGLRVTFGSVGDVTFGAVGTFSYAELDGDYCRTTIWNCSDERSWYGPQVGTLDAKLQQISVGVGATWQVFENLAVYGGGLFHHVRLKMDTEREYSYSSRHYWSSDSSTVFDNDDRESMFGGYLGVLWGITPDVSLSLEGACTGDGVGGSASLAFAF